MYGELLEEHYAAYDGRVMIMSNTLGVSEGDDAVFYGKTE